MSIAPLTDLSRCAIHTFTTKPLNLAQAVSAYQAAGVTGISVWRQHLEPYGCTEAARILADAGMSVPAYVRGGFFTGSESERGASIDDNKRCLDEAAAIGADQVVLVVGATPGMPLADARNQVTDGIAACLDHARGCGVKLAIEPLHPMYAGDKSCVNSMRQAREIWQELGDPLVGVAVDVYHVWFDQDLAEEIRLAGADQRIFGFHVCDWKCDTNNLLLDRGLMGEGCIDIRGIRQLVESAGFAGWIEVEIFSSTHWAKTQTDWLSEVTAAYLAEV
ncbi:MAG: sugar phosphate isomerase/epimerase [Planctomycetota bacterium]|jgi:sugar phosphate isomerase/epimerase|nr:sugar phosphate isomerase/epimerase [Planctomycetota bacterium]